MKHYPSSDKYCVYEHLFPNGKRYIEITHLKSVPPYVKNNRWNRNKEKTAS